VTEAEFKENMKDQLWRLNNLYWIINEDGKRVRFSMNGVQKNLYENMWYLNLILKSRQHGITTFVCIYFLDTCLFNSNIHAGIIAHNREDAESFFRDKVQYAFNNLPEGLRNATEAETESSRELAFPNGSAIRVGTSLRSSTNQLLHISEFGKICAKYPEKAREVVTGALNTVHQGQTIFIESTAEGRSGYFYDYCQKAMELAEKGIDLTPLEFKFFFFGWHHDPKNSLAYDSCVELSQDNLIYFDSLEKQGIKLTNRQKAWYALKLEQQGDDMKREHPTTPQEAFDAKARDCFFMGVLDGHVNYLRGQFGGIKINKQKELDFIENPRGILEIWRHPYQLTRKWDGHKWTYRYVIGSDISEGLGRDWSVAYVFDRYHKQFVARMRTNTVDSHKWGDKLVTLSRYYENALIVPERNGAGITTIDRLRELKANIYMRELVDKIGKSITQQYGYLETKEAKQLICGSLKSYLGSGKKVFDRLLLQECSTFIKDEEKEKLGADEGFHDDCVIAAALALHGDFYLPKCEKIPHPVTGWRKRQMEEKERAGVWAN
jgi:hypothetical protein